MWFYNFRLQREITEKTTPIHHDKLIQLLIELKN